ncbi:MAG: hypothetical protein HGGPFJEG_03083 [Ignavibacteria bacterium]|nr:hypothetical protein [Ignavibacteria bacterium]
MKKKLQLYNHLQQGNDKVDRSAFWICFALFVGFGAGVIISKFNLF